MQSKNGLGIEIGFQVFATEGGEEFGAVREVDCGGRPEIVVYVENSGEFVVPLSAVSAVHSQKVIVDVRKLDDRARKAIARAHASEKPGA